MCFLFFFGLFVVVFLGGGGGGVSVHKWSQRGAFGIDLTSTGNLAAKVALCMASRDVAIDVQSRAALRPSMRPLTITCTGIDQFIDCSTPSSDCGNVAKCQKATNTHSANVTQRPPLIDGIDSWHGSSVVRRMRRRTSL